MGPAQIKPARGDLDAGARDLFGHGGRLFVTTAADPSGGWLTTLVQADGDIVTRATADSIADAELLRRHNVQIAQWLASLQLEWRSIEAWADRVAGGAGAVTLGGGAALAATSHGALSLAAFAVFAAVGAARAAGATLFRRRFLRVN